MLPVKSIPPCLLLLLSALDDKASRQEVCQCVSGPCPSTSPGAPCGGERGAPAGSPMTDEKLRSLSISTHTFHLPLSSPLLPPPSLGEVSLCTRFVTASFTSSTSVFLFCFSPHFQFPLLPHRSFSAPFPPSVLLYVDARVESSRCVITETRNTHTHTSTHLETENTTRHYLAEKALPASLPLCHLSVRTLQMN